MAFFIDTNPFWEAVKITPRILTQPHVVLAVQNSQQEINAIKQSNEIIQESKLPSNREEHYEAINSKEQEEAYRKSL